MKVYLLNPPAINGKKRVREGRCQAQEGVWTTIWPPISLASIASLLEQKGNLVKITDAGTEGVDEKELEIILNHFRPDVLMINTSTPTIEFDLSIASLAKKIFPDLITVAFGIHVSQLPQECMKMQKDLDFIMHHEPEVTSVELVEALQKGKNLSNILGITYRDGSRVMTTPFRPYIHDLDSLPFPAWHLVNTDNYVLPLTRKKYLMITSARGCPHQCTFCVAKGYYGSRLRMRSPESVVKEMEWAGEKFGINDFLFWTESFTLNRSFVLNVCRLIQDRNLQVRWVCNSRVDCVDFEMLKEMKRAGCWMIGYGVESSDQKILDKSRKKINIEQIREACAMTKMAGIEISAHIVLGLPGETKETARKTIQFSRKMGFDYAQFYCATPWPGTDLFHIAQEEGWLKKSAPWSAYEQNCSILDFEGLSANEVMELREEAFRAFYFYPPTIWRTLKKIKSFSELKHFIWMVRTFFSNGRPNNIGVKS